VAGWSNGDYWIVKLDELGNIEWERKHGGTSEDRAHYIQQTTDGGFVVAGWSYSNLEDIGGNNGERDCLIVKLDEVGNLQWKKNYGGSDFDEAYSIQQTVAGLSNSNDGDVGGNNGSQDHWVLKLDPLRNLEWEQNYGGIGQDSACCIEQTIDGGYIFTGRALIIPI